jgi:hypothetical protein
MRRLNDFSRHPIRFVEKLTRRYGEGLELRFSRYKYKRRVREDRRKSFYVRIGDVDSGWLSQQLTNLAPDEELALESRVRVGGRWRHIPMIDFYGMKQEHLGSVLSVLPKFSNTKPFVYFSGRCFHAYFPILLTSREWLKFMGSVLLCNTPSRPRVVDQRWIGHRLVGGYAALRWSRNTSRYKAMPTRVAVGKSQAIPKTKKRRLLTVAAA